MNKGNILVISKDAKLIRGDSIGQRGWVVSDNSMFVTPVRVNVIQKHLANLIENYGFKDSEYLVSHMYKYEGVRDIAVGITGTAKVGEDLKNAFRRELCEESGVSVIDDSKVDVITKPEGVHYIGIVKGDNITTQDACEQFDLFKGVPDTKGKNKKRMAALVVGKLNNLVNTIGSSPLQYLADDHIENVVLINIGFIKNNSDKLFDHKPRQRKTSPKTIWRRASPVKSLNRSRAKSPYRPPTQGWRNKSPKSPNRSRAKSPYRPPTQGWRKKSPKKSPKSPVRGWGTVPKRR